MDALEPSSHRAGFVAILGRPNVGKSTLLNRILGQKLSITSRKPQTTRHRILGIKTTPEAQVAYVDTPGIHYGAKRALNRYMNRSAIASVQDVDVVSLMVDARAITDEDELVFAAARSTRAPRVLVLNKIDRLPARSDLLPLLASLAHRAEFSEVVPISALRGEGVDRLEAVVSRLLPSGPRIFPEEQLTDRSERFVAAELIREKFMQRLGQELPYRLSVQIEYFRESATIVDIGAVVWVESTAQKAIVIGKQGRVMKAVGTEARLELERLLESKVNLKLWAKVKENWSDSVSALRALGYE